MLTPDRTRAVVFTVLQTLTSDISTPGNGANAALGNGNGEGVLTWPMLQSRFSRYAVTTQPAKALAFTHARERVGPFGPTEPPFRLKGAFLATRHTDPALA